MSKSIGDLFCDILGEDAVREALSQPFKLFHCEHCMKNIKDVIDAAEDKGRLLAVKCPHCGQYSAV